MKYQIQAKYDPEQDRILFSVGDGDALRHAVWLTRRYTLLLLKVFGEFINRDIDVAPQAGDLERAEIRDWKAQKALDKANFSKPFDAEAEIEAIADTPLALELTYKMDKERLSSSLKSKAQPALNLTVDRDLTFRLIATIGNAAKAGDWQIPQGFLSSASSEGQSPSARTIN